MKAASFALAATLALAGCGGGGGGGGGNPHTVALAVQNIDPPSGKVIHLWYKACERAQVDPYGKEFTHFVPDWEPWIEIGAVFPGEILDVGEIPEGWYSFVWCRQDSLTSEEICPDCATLCPDGWTTFFCFEVLRTQEEQTVLEIVP